MVQSLSAFAWAQSVPISDQSSNIPTKACVATADEYMRFTRQINLPLYLNVTFNVGKVMRGCPDNCGRTAETNGAGKWEPYDRTIKTTITPRCRFKNLTCTGGLSGAT